MSGGIYDGIKENYGYALLCPFQFWLFDRLKNDIQILISVHTTTSLLWSSVHGVRYNSYQGLCNVFNLYTPNKAFNWYKLTKRYLPCWVAFSKVIFCCNCGIVLPISFETVPVSDTYKHPPIWIRSHLNDISAVKNFVSTIICLCMNLKSVRHLTWRNISLSMNNCIVLTKSA